MPSTSRVRFFTSAWLRNPLLLTGAFFPAIVAAFFIDRFAVDIPVWDDWERVHLIEKLEEGSLRFSDLYASHIEHRMVIPRILMLASNKWTNGDLLAENWMIYAIVLATAVAAFLLLRTTFHDEPQLLYPLAFCVNLLIFSPIQWENFLWAIQVAFVLPMCCICWALYVLYSKSNWPPLTKFLLCLALALVSTHSFSHGMLIWPVVFMFALLQSEFALSPSPKIKFLVTWAIAGAIVLGLYFTDFQNTSHSAHAYNQTPGEAPPSVANFSDTIANPGKALEFFGCFLGNSLARVTRISARELAPWMGWGLFACFGVAAIHWMWNWKQTAARDRALPWLALGGTAIVIAVMVALGRAEIAGVRSSITPRYIGMSLFLLVAVSVLGVIVISTRSNRSSTRLPILPLLAGLFFFAQIQTWAYGYARMKEWESSRLHARTSLLFINHFLPASDNRLDADVHETRRLANRLDDYGYLKYPLVNEATTSPFKSSSRPLNRKRWNLDAATYDREHGALKLEGWTTLPESSGGMAAHGVLVTTKNGTDHDTVLQIASIHAYPKTTTEVQDNAFNFTRELARPDFSSWTASIPFASIFDSENASAPVDLRLLAVDAKKMRTYPLGIKLRCLPMGPPLSKKIKRPSQLDRSQTYSFSR